MSYIIVFKSRVDQEAIFGCEAQPHTGRNALFLVALLAAGLCPAAQPVGYWDLHNRTRPTVRRPGDLDHFFLELSAKIHYHPQPLVFRKKFKKKSAYALSV